VTPTFGDALTYIAGSADDAEIDLIVEAVQQRRKLLRAIVASRVTVGMATRIDNISPKYLVGMTGEVVEISGKYAKVRLDKRSTSTLRVRGGRRFYVPNDTDSYLMSGIPTSCCLPA
jgi:aspartokinase-like uncharacterized kinase